jgi:N-acyl-D-amino-acid deacylase
MIFADPLHEPKVRQGITTEVIGVDGLSYAPIPDPDDLEALAHMNAGLDGRPDIAYDWGSVESYLDRLDALHPSVNLAFLVGNSALRMAAMGWDESRQVKRTSRTCARCSERRWRRGPSASRQGWTIRPAPTPAPMSWCS